MVKEPAGPPLPDLANSEKQAFEEEMFVDAARAFDVPPPAVAVKEVAPPGRAVERESQVDLKPFEAWRYDGMKERYDPLHTYLRETAGVDAAGYYISYKTTQSIERDPGTKDLVCNSKQFSNYTDLRQFRSSLNPDTRAEFDSHTWEDRRGIWRGVTVAAHKNFWSELSDEKSRLYPHREQLLSLIKAVESEQVEDGFAKAVAAGEVKPEQPSKTWLRLAGWFEQLPGQVREKVGKIGKRKKSAGLEAPPEGVGSGAPPEVSEAKGPEALGALALPETAVQPESHAKRDEKPSRWGAVDKKVLLDVGWRTIGTVLGVKSIGDLALATKGRGDIYEATRGKQVKTERTSAESAVKEFLRENRSGTAETFRDKRVALEQQIKDAKYLSPEDRKAYRKQLADVIRKYRNEGAALDNVRDVRINKAAELYFQKKVSTARVIGDALNTAFTLGGMPVLRSVGYAGAAIAERWRKAGIQFEREELKRSTAKQPVVEATPGPVLPMTPAERSKRNYQLKDLTITSTLETFRAASGFKKSGASTTRFRDALEAWGSLARFAGLTGVAVAELGENGVSDGVAKLLEAYQQNGGSQILENFKVNLDRTFTLFTDPGEYFSRLGRGFEGSDKQTIVTGAGSKGLLDSFFEDRPTGEGGSAEGGVSGETVAVPAQSELSPSNQAVRELSDTVKVKQPSVPKHGEPTVVFDTPQTKAGAGGKPVELPAESVRQYQQAVSKGELTESDIESYLKTHTVDKAKPPTVDDISKFSELTKVGDGGSYWSTFKKQYGANPRSFGYEGDIAAKAAVDSYGKRLVVDYAFKHGLVSKNADGSLTDVRIKNLDARVLWSFDEKGGLEMTQSQAGRGAGTIDTYKHTAGAGAVTEAAPEADREASVNEADTTKAEQVSQPASELPETKVTTEPTESVSPAEATAEPEAAVIPQETIPYLQAFGAEAGFAELDRAGDVHDVLTSATATPQEQLEALRNLGLHEKERIDFGEFQIGRMNDTYHLIGKDGAYIYELNEAT